MLACGIETTVPSSRRRGGRYLPAVLPEQARAYDRRSGYCSGHAEMVAARVRNALRWRGTVGRGTGSQ